MYSCIKTISSESSVPYHVSIAYSLRYSNILIIMISIYIYNRISIISIILQCINKQGNKK